AHPRRPRLLRGERRGLGGRAVEGAGKHGVSDALDRLRGERDRRLLPARRDRHADAPRRHRCHHRRRVHRRTLLTSMADFLPFTRPSIDEATIAGVAEVLRSGWITTGPNAKAFEAALSEHCGGRPVRAYSSGTITMEIALRLAGVGQGDEVITTPLTWVSTANVVLEVGARPVFVDVDPKTRNIDLSLIQTN